MVIELLSCPISRQEEIYRNLDCNRGNLQDVTTSKFIAWGSFDLMTISLVARADSAIGLAAQPTPEGVFNRQSFYATPLDTAAVESASPWPPLPLAGVSFLKFKEYLTAAIPDSHMGSNFHGWLVEEMRDFQVELGKERGCALTADRIQIIPCLSTGWADCIIVFFANSYSLIQDAVVNLRSTTLKKIESRIGPFTNAPRERPHHALVTTCTIPATQITYEGDLDDGVRQAAVDAVCARIDEDDPSLTLAIGVEARPGHVYTAQALFDNENLVAYPTLGRSDMCVTNKDPKEGVTHRDFLELMVTKVLPSARKDDTSATSSETRIGFPKKDSSKESSNKPSQTSFVPYEHTFPCDRETLEMVVSKHTITALAKIGHSLTTLMQDEATRAYYGPLADLYQVACDGLHAIEHLVPRQERWSRRQVIIREKIGEDLSNFCEKIELCFKDRYRGAYPVGETSAIPSLASHGSFHKVLLSVDTVANACLSCLSEQLACKLEAQGVTHRLPRMAACSYIGNSVSPFVMVGTSLGIGFVNVPVQLMFIPYGMTYVLHEAAHIFWENLFIRLSDAFWEVANHNEIAWRQVREILCDYVSLCLAFRGNIEQAENLTAVVCEDLIAEGGKQQGKANMRLRVDTAWMLYYVMRLPDPESMFEVLLQSLRSTPSYHASLLEESAAFVRMILDLMAASTEFRAALDTVQSLARIEATSLNAGGGAVLLKMQEFFERDSPTPSEVTDFMHKLWQVCLRTDGLN